MKTKAISAKGIKGFILYDPFQKDYFFRRYVDDSYIDYNLKCLTIPVELTSNINILIESDEENYIDFDVIATFKNPQKH